MDDVESGVVAMVGRDDGVAVNSSRFSENASASDWAVGEWVAVAEFMDCGDRTDTSATD